MEQLFSQEALSAAKRCAPLLANAKHLGGDAGSAADAAAPPRRRSRPAAGGGEAFVYVPPPGFNV